MRGVCRNWIGILVVSFAFAASIGVGIGYWIAGKEATVEAKVLEDPPEQVRDTAPTIIKLPPRKQTFLRGNSGQKPAVNMVRSGDNLRHLRKVTAYPGGKSRVSVTFHPETGEPKHILVQLDTGGGRIKMLREIEFRKDGSVKYVIRYDKSGREGVQQFYDRSGNPTEKGHVTISHP